MIKVEDDWLGNIDQILNNNFNGDLFELPDNTTLNNMQGNTLENCEPWPGDYGFSCTVSSGSSWVYSDITSMLYVNINTPCQFDFKTEISPPENCQIRAKIQFTSPKKPCELVNRCPHHSVGEHEINKGESSSKICHIVRCESAAAFYETDEHTGEKYVSVPYIHPPELRCSSYLYKFMCLNSCLGGINRRPIRIVFSLIKNGNLLGRDIVKLKVCSCPNRDRHLDEVKNCNMKRKVSGTGSLVEAGSSCKLIKQETKGDMPSNKRKTKASKDAEKQEYVIYANSKAEYEFLLKTQHNLKKFFKV